MDREALRNDLRSMLDDPEMPGQLQADASPDEDSLWSNAELNQWLNEAVAEACLRSRLIIDSSTASVCQITTSAGTSDYTYDKSIILIQRITIQGEPKELIKTTSHVLDRNFPDWQNNPQREPEYWLLDMGSRTLTLAPPPDKAYTLELTVWRKPLASEEMENDNDEPVINEIHHPNLIHFAAYRAYLKNDEDTVNPQKAREHLAIFNSVYGERPSAHQLSMWNRERPPSAPAYFF